MPKKNEGLGGLLDGALETVGLTDDSHKKSGRKGGKTAKKKTTKKSSK